MQNKGMTEANLIIGILIVGISTLLVGLATLIVSIRASRSARRSLELSEDRMEYLREEQDRLAFLREERQTLAEELKQQRQERLEAQQKADHLERERRKSPEAQQEGPQMGRESAMKPPQEVLHASSKTDAVDEERPGGIRNTGTEGRSSEAHDDPDSEVTVDGEPAVLPKEVGRGTTNSRPSGSAVGGAAQDERETQQRPARRPQEGAENSKESALVRVRWLFRQR